MAMTVGSGEPGMRGARGLIEDTPPRGYNRKRNTGGTLGLGRELRYSLCQRVFQIG